MISLGFVQKNEALYRRAAILALVTIVCHIAEGLVSDLIPSSKWRQASASGL